MKIAIKKIDINKIDINKIENRFSAKLVGTLVYQPELAEHLDEIIFEFDVKHEIALIDFLKESSVIGRVLFNVR